MKHRDQDVDFWMDWAIVESLPFLYFLKYKVYRYLQRYQDQQQALSKLSNIIKTDKNLRYRETALNILGQCMEHENRPKQALKCYLLSLQQRTRNNVANIHICRLLSSLLVCKENRQKSHTHCSMKCLILMLYLRDRVYMTESAA
jgi:tetratricopeptide (TPR) repeat protein